MRAYFVKANQRVALGQPIRRPVLRPGSNVNAMASAHNGCVGKITPRAYQTRSRLALYESANHLPRFQCGDRHPGWSVYRRPRLCHLIEIESGQTIRIWK